MIDQKELSKDIELYNDLRNAMGCLLAFDNGIKHEEGTNRVVLSFRSAAGELSTHGNATRRAKEIADCLEAIREEETRRITFNDETLFKKWKKFLTNKKK